MMICKYSDRDLAQRLDNSVCRYKGLPRIVRYIGEKTLELREMGTENLKEVIKSDDPDFDISTVPLGYVQETPDRVVYFARRPARMWKQGLSNDSVTAESLTKSSDVDSLRGRRGSIYSSQFGDMILGRYPDVHKTLELIVKSNKEKEVAISRDIALQWAPDRGVTYVYYKQYQIGFIPEGTNTIITDSNDMGWIITKKLSGFSWEVK